MNNSFKVQDLAGKAFMFGTRCENYFQSFAYYDYDLVSSLNKIMKYCATDYKNYVVGIYCDDFVENYDDEENFIFDIFLLRNTVFTIINNKIYPIINYSSRDSNGNIDFMFVDKDFFEGKLNDLSPRIKNFHESIMIYWERKKIKLDLIESLTFKTFSFSKIECVKPKISDISDINRIAHNILQQLHLKEIGYFP